MQFDIEADKRIAAVIPIEFWTDHEDVAGENVLVDWVRWQKIGNPNQQMEGKIKKVKKFYADVWTTLEPYYNAWKKNEQEPVNGTPINNWPPVTKRLSEVLKTNGFRSVEDLSKATDADLGRIGMGALALRDKAREFVLLKTDTKNAGQIDDLKKTLELMKEKIAYLEEQNEALKEQKEAKRRGRPPKEVTE